MISVAIMTPFRCGYCTSTSYVEFILWHVSNFCSKIIPFGKNVVGKFCSNIIPFAKYLFCDLCPDFLLKSPIFRWGFVNPDFFLSPTQMFVISCISLTYATYVFPPAKPVTALLMSHSLMYTAAVGVLFMSFVGIMLGFYDYADIPC